MHCSCFDACGYSKGLRARIAREQIACSRSRCGNLSTLLPVNPHPHTSANNGQPTLPHNHARYDLAGHEITEVSSTGAWNRGEVYAGGRHLATYNNSTMYFNQADWLGTERARTSMAAAVCETVVNTPFRDGQATSGTCDPSPMHFTGKQRDT